MESQAISRRSEAARTTEIQGPAAASSGKRLANAAPAEIFAAVGW
jgi:hypothetical protein